MEKYLEKLQNLIFVFSFNYSTLIQFLRLAYMDIHVEKPISVPVLIPPQDSCLLLATLGIGPRIQACWNWWEGEIHVLIFKIRRGTPEGSAWPRGEKAGFGGH